MHHQHPSQAHQATESQGHQKLLKSSLTQWEALHVTESQGHRKQPRKQSISSLTQWEALQKSRRKPRTLATELWVGNNPSHRKPRAPKVVVVMVHLQSNVPKLDVPKTKNNIPSTTTTTALPALPTPTPTLPTIPANVPPPWDKKPRHHHHQGVKS